MKRSIFLFSLILLCTAGFVLAQTPTKVTVSKHANGKPEVLNYYKGETMPSNLMKQEKFSVDGKKVQEKNFLNGKLHGAVLEWKEFDGTKVAELNYVDGLMDGKQMFYFSDGKPKMELNYVAGKLDGRQVEYWFKKSTDSLKTEHHYSGGILHGMQRQWTKDNQNVYNFNFVAGKPDGLQRTWTEGVMKEERWKQGTYEEWLKNWSAAQPQHTKVFDYVPKGDSMNLSLGKSLQKEAWYYESGALEALTTVSGEPETQIFYLGGKLKGKGKGTFDVKVGKWEFYHQNGKKMMAGEFNKEGKQVGLFESWDENGRLVSEEFWNPNGSGRETWKVFRYHPSGTKEMEGTLDMAGHKKGKWKYWYANGNKKSEEDWDYACTSGKGRPYIVTLSEWDDSGRLIVKGDEAKEQQITYFPNGNPSEIKTMVYLNRDACAKGPVDVYKEGNFSQEVAGPTLYDDAVLVEKMTFYETGDTMRIDRFNNEGKRHGYQVGWYSDGKKQYEYHYNNGGVQGAVKEWYPTGQIMLDHKYSSVSGGTPSLQEGIYYTDKGKDYPYSAADGKKKNAMEDIDAISYFTKFWQQNK
jgi:uncharacterized protein